MKKAGNRAFFENQTTNIGMMGRRKKKCKNEAFEATVNRIRSSFCIDYKKGNTHDSKHNFCPWEWAIYDYWVKRYELQQRLMDIKRKMQEHLAEGDDF